MKKPVKKAVKNAVIGVKATKKMFLHSTEREATGASKAKKIDGRKRPDGSKITGKL